MIVIDLGVLVLGVNCIVIVNIIDVNDNNFVFIEVVYFLIVNENLVNNIFVV